MHKAIVRKNSEALDRIEVVMPGDQVLARIVDERIAEILSEAATADLQPFFERPEVAEVMRRTQHVLERRKWVWYVSEYGCLFAQEKTCAMRDWVCVPAV